MIGRMSVKQYSFHGKLKPQNIVRFAYHTQSMTSQIFLALRLVFLVKTASHLKEMKYVFKMCKGRSLRLTLL